MFDVVNLVDDLTITGFDLNLDLGTFNVEIYSKTGSYLGFETDASAWSLIDSGSITSSGTDQASFFDVSDFLLNGFSSTSLYITLSDATDMNYLNGTNAGAVYVDNGDIQILEGVGVSYAFDRIFNPRVWSGNIYYESASSTPSVPSPAPLLLMDLGFLGVGLAKLKLKL